MFKRLFSLSLVVALAVAFFPLFAAIGDHADTTDLAGRYLAEGPEALGSANLVTSVIVTYRGLDTLGEVTVLFAAAAGIGLVFSRMQTSPDTRRRATNHPPSELVVTGAGLLLPLIALFGVFIFVHGHLTPGGGFQGGVIVASGVLLAFLAGTLTELSHGLLTVLEMVAGAGYVAVGLLGLWLAGGFLDPRFLPTGEIGSLFSGGAIPIIYTLIGIKVGAELSGVLDSMRQRRMSQ